MRRTGSLWLASAEEAPQLQSAVAELTAAGVDCREAPELVPAPMRPHYPRAAVFPGDCQLQPARWVAALAGAAVSAGARIHERSPALAIERRGGRLGVRSRAGTASGRAVVVACDGLISRLVPELTGIVYPVRGQMLATAPLADPVLRLPTHSDHGFVYAQPTRDGRLAIGGCRYADLEAEYTDDARPTAPVQRALERFIAERIGLAGVAVTHRWAGIMGFSADLLPGRRRDPGTSGAARRRGLQRGRERAGRRVRTSGGRRDRRPAGAARRRALGRPVRPRWRAAAAAAAARAGREPAPRACCAGRREAGTSATPRRRRRPRACGR